jgi:hypothetical protein
VVAEHADTLDLGLDAVPRLQVELERVGLNRRASTRTLSRTKPVICSTAALESAAAMRRAGTCHIGRFALTGSMSTT